MWKGNDALGGLPAQATLTAALTYQGKKYAYTANYQYQEWNAALGNGSSEGDLVLINNVNTSQIVNPPLSAQGAVSRLGISFSQLPHDTTLDASQGEDTPVTAIVPSGAATETVVAALQAAGQAPVQPATSAGKSRDIQRKKDLADIQQALVTYKAKTGSYPTVAQGEQVASSQTLFTALVPTYLTKMPLDPLSGTYYYYYQSVDGKSFILRSILEDASDASAKKGTIYSFYELTK